MVASKGVVPCRRSRSRRRSNARAAGDDGTDADAGQVQFASKAAELKEEMDDILDEIDSVLEENAEEFVKSYVQKGGE